MMGRKKKGNHVDELVLSRTSIAQHVEIAIVALMHHMSFERISGKKSLVLDIYTKKGSEDRRANSIIAGVNDDAGSVYPRRT